MYVVLSVRALRSPTSFLLPSNLFPPLRLINSEYEHIALHRDVGETELKQGREMKIHHEGGGKGTGTTLVYTDSAAVRAVKYGRVLIIEGVEKAERGIMPVSSLFCLERFLTWC